MRGQFLRRKNPLSVHTLRDNIVIIETPPCVDVATDMVRVAKFQSKKKRILLVANETNLRGIMDRFEKIGISDKQLDNITFARTTQECNLIEVFSAIKTSKCNLVLIENLENIDTYRLGDLTRLSANTCKSLMRYALQNQIYIIAWAPKHRNWSIRDQI